jgi:hypothetical protein
LPQDETVQRILSKAAGKGAFSSFMQQLLEAVESLVRALPKVSGATSQKVMAASMKNALEEALREKKQVWMLWCAVVRSTTRRGRCILV